MAIRFLHTADLHLGLRVTRFEPSACDRIVEARFKAIENLRARAVESRADFILVAGDTFDDHSVSKRVAERTFELFEGKSLGCPVYIIPGNHDPLAPGGVWDREPWTREQPTKHVRLLRDCQRVQVPDRNVVLFPCPLRHRNSIDDPTAWIGAHPRAPGDDSIRIGLAHGSLKIIPHLPEDDHLIRADAAEAYGLDYLALGHWHRELRRGPRTAYPGTHEPMRFPNERSGGSTGWTSFSSDGDAERFDDGGRGTALLVTIDGAGATPVLETIDVGHLRWTAERRDLTGTPIGRVVSEFAQPGFPAERTLLKLTLCGITDPSTFQRVGEVREIVQRYLVGSILDADSVLVQPDESHLRERIGTGVVHRVFERLKADAESPDPDVQRVARHALKLLCRFAWEDAPS